MLSAWSRSYGPDAPSRSWPCCPPPGPGWSGTAGLPKSACQKLWPTTSWSYDPVTRSWWTVRWSRPRAWRSTNRCSPERLTRSTGTPATKCSQAASWPPVRAVTGPREWEPTRTPLPCPKRPADSSSPTANSEPESTPSCAGWSSSSPRLQDCYYCVCWQPRTSGQRRYGAPWPPRWPWSPTAWFFSPAWRSSLGW